MKIYKVCRILRTIYELLLLVLKKMEPTIRFLHVNFMYQNHPLNICNFQLYVFCM